MARASAAKRYAQAAFAIARERGQVDLWGLELWVAEEALQNEELRALLEQAAIPMSRKARIIADVLKGVNSLVQNLVCLLVSRRRLSLISGIRQEYTRLVDVYHGRERVQVVSAVPLDTDEQERVTRLLREMVGREVVLESRVDPETLGGLVIQVGDKLIDGSVRGRLEGLKESLAGDRRHSAT